MRDAAGNIATERAQVITLATQRIINPPPRFFHSLRWMLDPPQRLLHPLRPTSHHPRRTPDPPRPPMRRGAQFGPPSANPEPVVEKVTLGAKTKREKKPTVKADPAHIAAARELRDRYLEQFNSGMILPSGKYAVSRQIETKPPTPLMLEQAA